jgi:hypothetical protein
MHVMPSEVSHAELARVRDWAKHQLADGREQPWSAFLLRRLGETIDALLAGMAATQAEAGPQAAPGQATPRLVVCNSPRDSERGSRGPLRSRASERPFPGAKSKPPVTEPAI